MTCAPMSQLWSKAGAGQPDKGVDLLIFQIQVTPSACLICVRSRFNLHHQVISHTEALGQKLKSEECRCYRYHRGCDICSCWAVSKNNEVPGWSQHSRAEVARLSEFEDSLDYIARQPGLLENNNNNNNNNEAEVLWPLPSFLFCLRWLTIPSF